MWLQRITSYLLRHRYRAMALTFIVTFIPFIGILGILIAALMTLSRGIVEGAIFTAAATLPYVLTFFFPGNDQAMPLVLWTVMGVAVLSNVLTWVFAVMLRKQTSWSAILQIAALAGVLVVSVVHLVYPDVANWWGTQLQAYYAHAQAMAATLKNTAANVAITNDAQLEKINITKQYATGSMIVGILFNAILQLVVARWWQAAVFARGSLRRELHGIRLSQTAGALFILSLVLSYLGNTVVLDIMPILYVLFCAAGLSLVHYLFGLMRSPTTLFWLALFYITLILSMPTSIMLVAMLALLDIGLDLRKRFKKV